MPAVGMAGKHHADAEGQKAVYDAHVGSMGNSKQVLTLTNLEFLLSKRVKVVEVFVRVIKAQKTELLSMNLQFARAIVEV